MSRKTTVKQSRTYPRVVKPALCSKNRRKTSLKQNSCTGLTWAALFHIYAQLDSTVRCELTRHFHTVLSPSCVVAEDSRSRERFQVALGRGCPCLQLASSSSVPLVRRCGEEKVLDHLTFGTSCGMFKPAEPSLHEQCRFTYKAEAEMQFQIASNRPYISL